jgi:hypothetical protein
MPRCISLHLGSRIIYCAEARALLRCSRYAELEGTSDPTDVGSEEIAKRSRRSCACRVDLLIDLLDLKVELIRLLSLARLVQCELGQTR